jgi:hypothetical protein
MPPITPTAAGVRLQIRVQPRASHTELAGLHGDALKVRLAAAPVDGAANDALVRFLAECLGVPRSAVSLLSGASSRVKVVEVTGVGVENAKGRLGLYRTGSEGST